MSVGLIALLDDVASLAKVAAASLDDVATQAAKAGAKAAGVVIDDAAVTPRYVVGFAASRELPIVRRIAVGSLKNKLVILLPVALLLSQLAPWAITPLLILGGAYLCYEGAEKVYEKLAPHDAHAHEAETEQAAADPQAFEDRRVAGAIRTDFILSAEIMAIALATVPEAGFWMQAAILSVVGLGITFIVYGAVALIVKADDAGVALAANPTPVSGLWRRDVPSQPTGADRAVRPLTQALGRGLVLGMPWFLQALAVVGTAAMVWVGGGIIIHSLAGYGLGGIEHALHDVAVALGRASPFAGGFVEWLVTAAGSGVFGLLVGFAIILLLDKVILPLRRRLRGAPSSATDTAPR
jgi:hypothetical protein